MRHPSFRPFGFGLSVALVTACGGGGGGGGGSSSSFLIAEASNGFGKLLPHQIRVKDANGQPTNQVVEITQLDQLLANVTFTNPVLPTTEWPVDAVLPDNQPGNHYVYVRFTQALDPVSVLSRSSASDPGSLGAGIQVETVDPQDGVVTPLEGFAFVGGKTFGPDTDPNDPSRFLLQTWVQRNGDVLEAVPIGPFTPGLGFPGTESTFAGATQLVEPSTFVFVHDTDGNLQTHEAFPVGTQVQVRIGTQVRSASNRPLGLPGLAFGTVGPDTTPPELRVVPVTQDPMVLPTNNALNVDPETSIEVVFSEPVQILRVGDIDDGTAPSLSSAIQVTFGPSTNTVEVPFTVEPISVYDMTRFRLTPSYAFPGTGPTIPGVACDSVFGSVSLKVNPQQLDDLALTPNKNTKGLVSGFRTREGPGLVNAPVTPDALYIGRTGSNQGISVIDLNGFGAGTGDPRYDIENPIVKSHSNFPNNPNVALTGAQLIPPLRPGSCTFDGGSSGPFTLTRDSSLRDLVASAPLLESVGDMALGHSLDNTFNNEQPFGCQAGGGNICASSGLKTISIISGGPNTVASVNVSNQAPLKTDPGVENLVSWAPHPNPPPLTYPPLCLSPLINALEPTAIDSTAPPAPQPFPTPPYRRNGPGLRNLLVPGPFPLGIPDIGLPPQSTLTTEQNCYFEGPSTPQPNIGLCDNYMMRQQVGQFLYVIDRVAGEVVVFNSNRFTVLDRIRLPDPTSFAMSPNVDFLAVTNEGADQVSFLDVDPSSATFHQVIRTTRVGTGPTGIAWESANEDIFVCNQGEGTVSVISGFTLDVRKTLRNQLTRPIEVGLTPRQTSYGFLRGVYFGYVLNQNGKVAIFESGPDGINGFGFDDIIASLPFTFARPKTMQVDPTNLNSAVWIAHELPLDESGNPTGQGGGALTNVGISGGTVGIIPLDPGPFVNPSLRDLQFSVLASIGEGPNGLSGIPIDVAYDNLRNLSALTNFATVFSPGNPTSYNGKGQVRLLGGAALQSSAPLFMFAAVPNPGVVDVYDMTGGAFERVDTDAFVEGFQSIPCPNASVLMDYFRQ